MLSHGDKQWANHQALLPKAASSSSLSVELVDHSLTKSVNEQSAESSLGASVPLSDTVASLSSTFTSVLHLRFHPPFIFWASCSYFARAALIFSGFVRLQLLVCFSYRLFHCTAFHLQRRHRCMAKTSCLDFNQKCLHYAQIHAS